MLVKMLSLKQYQGFLTLDKAKNNFKVSWDYVMLGGKVNNYKLSWD